MAFKKVTVDSILAGFQKTIQELTSLGEQKDTEAKGIRARILNLDAEAGAAETEASRARAAAEKISGLLA